MKRGQFISLSLVALFLTLTSTVLASNTWYVDGVNGNDANDCQTALTGCKTIGHAISLASSGDSIIVAAATYTENLTVGFSLNLIGSGANTTIIDGGGVSRVVTINSGVVTLSDVTIRDGRVEGLSFYDVVGGGIYNNGELTINESTVSGNLAFSSSTSFLAYGGGIFNAGTLTINNSTISGNTAWCGLNPLDFNCPDFGGGIFNRGKLLINNSTLAGNNTRFGYGGGIYNAGILAINNSTLSENAAFRGGGGIYGGGATLQNSIVANNGRGNCSQTISSKGHNLSSDNTCNFNGPGDLNNTDPKLGVFGYNGGPTQTIPLLSGSPAIDAGNPNGCTDAQGNLLKTDQRGMPRPDPGDTGGCDMGAYESQSN
jgi:hypothetical protein